MTPVCRNRWTIAYAGVRTALLLSLVSFYIRPLPFMAREIARAIPMTTVVALEAGTQIVARTIGAIDSVSDEGTVFPATIAVPILNDQGGVLFPAGEDCVLTVTGKRNAGKFAGRPSLTLELTSVTVNGRVYPLATDGVVEKGSSHGVATSRSALIGSGVGIVIAGIAHTGGGGMAASAGAGGAAGVWLGSRMKPSKVSIPPETQITFTLRESAALGGQF